MQDEVPLKETWFWQSWEWGQPSPPSLRKSKWHCPRPLGTGRGGWKARCGVGILHQGKHFALKGVFLGFIDLHAQ